jgi:hypothetical protein
MDIRTVRMGTGTDTKGTVWPAVVYEKTRPNGKVSETFAVYLKGNPIGETDRWKLFMRTYLHRGYAHEEFTSLNTRGAVLIEEHYGE